MYYVVNSVKLHIIFHYSYFISYFTVFSFFHNYLSQKTTSNEFHIKKIYIYYNISKIYYNLFVYSYNISLLTNTNVLLIHNIKIDEIN